MRHNKRTKGHIYRFVKPLFVVLVIFTLFLPVQLVAFDSVKTSVAQAATPPQSELDLEYTQCVQGNTGPTAGVQATCKQQISDNYGIDYQPSTGTNPTPKPNTPPAGTQPNNDIGCATSFSICISNVVYVFTVGIMSVFAYIGGYMFSAAVALSLNSIAYAQDFLSVGWTVVRDMANVAFIFILIYLAFTIIFQAETAGTLKTLALVVIMALLINFSFFITRVIVDGGNILAVQFYNQINAPPLDQTAAQNGTSSGAALTNALSGANTKDLTSSIMGVMRLQNLFNTQSFQTFFHDQTGLTGFLTVVITLSLIYISVGIMFGILAATFFFVGFKFVLRLVALWAIIVGAPIAFVARTLTNKNAQGLYHMWQDALVKFSFYPAIFLFIFMLTNYILLEMAKLSGGNFINGIFQDVNASSAQINTSNPFTWVIGRAIASTALRLGIVIIMLYYGMRLADVVVKQGNSAARGFTNWVGQRLGGLTYGTLGLVGRNTAGLAFRTGGAAAAQVASGKQGFLGQRLWTGVSKTANWAGARSFDVRTPLVRQGVKDVTGKPPTAQLDIGGQWRGGVIPGPRFTSGKKAPPPAAPAAIRAQTAGQQQAISAATNANNRAANDNEVLSPQEEQERRTIPPKPANDNEPRPATIPVVAAAPGAASAMSATGRTPRSTANPQAPMQPDHSGATRQITGGGGRTASQMDTEQRTDSIRDILKTIRDRGGVESAQQGNAGTASGKVNLPTAAVLPPAAAPSTANRAALPTPVQTTAAARIAQAGYGVTLPSTTKPEQSLWSSTTARVFEKEDRRHKRQMLEELRKLNKNIGILSAMIARSAKGGKPSAGPRSTGAATHEPRPHLELRQIDIKPSPQQNTANDNKKMDDGGPPIAA